MSRPVDSAPWGAAPTGQPVGLGQGCAWRQVVAESGAPWGSQAHHFPGGKQQLAAEAVAIAGSAYERMLRAALESSHPADAVLAWADLAARQLEASGWVDGCPVATVALEEAAT